ncbi:hypothetical protein BH10PLA2_BH10PLA2_08110 [soil metagenome]
MASEQATGFRGESFPSGRTTGIVMGVASLLAVLFMAYHPRVHASTNEELFAGISKVAFINKLVHGSLIALEIVLAVAFSCLASRLGNSSLLVRTGYFAYLTGAITLSAAALINGFVLTDFVARYVGRTKETLDIAKHALAYGGVANQVCSRMGVLAMSIAVALWSIKLISMSGGVRAVGIFGCISGGIPAAALLLGYLHMDVHGMLAFVLSQTLWSLAVAWLLVRGRI